MRHDDELIRQMNAEHKAKRQKPADDKPVGKRKKKKSKPYTIRGKYTPRWSSTLHHKQQDVVIGRYARPEDRDEALKAIEKDPWLKNIYEKIYISDEINE